MLRGAGGAEDGAFVGLFHTLQNDTADAFARFLGAVFGYPETLFRIETLPLPAQAQTAGRNFTDATPLLVDHFEDFQQ